MNIARPLAMVSLALAMTLSVSARTSAQQPDNSSQNKNQTTTADSQSSAKSDRMLTQQARKAVMADKDLSVYAHNVKIIAVNGSITLRGPVKSEEEKQKVASDIASVAGGDKISNQLTVKQ